ncbi:MAG TPA: DUF4118 domain-containing protein [Terriglobales bacterium]|nr:DUF4118 domain-containing protein [Terriglobales bacterium]
MRVRTASALETQAVSKKDSSVISQSNIPFAEVFPFIGLSGRVFMWICWLAEIVDDWTRAKSHTREQLEAAVSKKFGSRVAGWLSSLIAAACCTLAALCVLPLFWAHSLHPLAPLFFLLVIAYIAMRFGDMAGIVGTMGAAFVFAFFLFEPSGLAVSSPIERNRLISMIIVGLLVSELLGRRKQPAVYGR